MEIYADIACKNKSAEQAELTGGTFIILFE